MMSKVPEQQVAAAKLNELMIKKGITPNYELINSETGTHINKFLTRVSCALERNGPIHSADGSGLSKKESKHQAALAFMRKYNLGDNDNNPTITIPRTIINPTITWPVDIPENNRNAALRTLCFKYDLGNPKYEEVEMRGPPHSRHFIIRCSVRDLSTDGVGSTKSEAKLQATTKMIAVLKQEAEVYRVFGSTKSTIPPNTQEIVPINILGSRKSSFSSLSSDIYPASDKSSVCLLRARSIDNPRVVVGSINNYDRVSSVIESSDDSASNMSLIDLEDDCQKEQKGDLDKAKSRSLDNLSNLSKLDRNLNWAEGIDKIESTLENVEQQLYNEILDTLENRDLPRQRSVTILSHEFQIYINNETRPKIFEGDQKCTDSSIRMAALTKLLVDLKDHARSTCKLLQKKGAL